MRQNITIATIKAINIDKGYAFFDNLRKDRQVASERGYMSKDGKVAWFWTLGRDDQKFSIHAFECTTGIIWKNAGFTTAGTPVEATEKCRKCCMAYDRDRQMVNPTVFQSPAEIPKLNLKGTTHVHF